MSSVTYTLDDKIRTFMSDRERKHPELRKSADQLFEDLVREDHGKTVF